MGYNIFLYPVWPQLLLKKNIIVRRIRYESATGVATGARVYVFCLREKSTNWTT